jgi:hypothetical protein
MFANVPLSLLLLFVTSSLFGQRNTTDSLNKSWSFSLAAYYYFVPEDENAASFIGRADHKQLHIEGRYNYEAKNTASLFTGWKLEGGNKVEFALTPMLGIVFGDLDGLAPGAEVEVAWNKFHFYSETEYVIDLSAHENNFLYTWGELAYNPTTSIRAGVTFQRTLLYQTNFEVQRGIFAQYAFRRFSIGAYYFNPLSSNNLLVGTLSLSF